MSKVTEKMYDLLGVWGPYSKKYSGISRIVDHKTDSLSSKIYCNISMRECFITLTKYK